MTNKDLINRVISQVQSIKENDGYIRQDDVLEILRSMDLYFEQTKPRKSFFQRVKSVLSKSPKPVKSLLKQIEEAEVLDPLSKLDQFSNYSYEYAYVIDPLKMKDQDSISVYVNDRGFGVIVCDGISGEGGKSGEYARKFSRHLASHLTNFPQNNGKSQNNDYDAFLNYLTMGVNSINSSIQLDSGGTTLISGYHDAQKNALYLSWMGDGHALYFNSQITGFSKLLIPQRDKFKRLKAAISANGIIGNMMSQIHLIDDGILVLSTDGFELGNGKVLNHFVRSVLTKEDLQEALDTWISVDCCTDDEKGKLNYHPQKYDDRSMAIIRFKQKVQSKGQ